MSWLVGFLIWAGFAICLICALMANRNYDTMLDQVNRRLPDDQKIKRPIFANMNYYEVVRLHSQLYPGSRVRAKSRFLMRLMIITFGSLAFIAVAWVIFKGPMQR